MSSTPLQPSNNWSIHAIPAAYGLGFAPYLYQFGRGMTASGFQATNVLPRTNLEFLKGKVSETVWSSLVRARGAHLNALEVFPFFAVAMVSVSIEDESFKLTGNRLLVTWLNYQPRI